MTVNQQIEHWLTAHKQTFSLTNRPFVTLSYAQSWDGSITTRAGESLCLSGSQANRLTHQLRSLHEGILVGIGTVLSDNPQLTVREWAGANPQPIVLDSHLRLPPTARLCQHLDKRCWVLTCVADTLSFGKNAEIFKVSEDANGQVDLLSALQLLRDKGIKMLMVEGGSQIITAFLKAQVADALVLTIAPTLIGGYKAIDNLGLNCKTQLPKIHPLQIQMLGEDLIMWGDLKHQNQALS